jgi:hypothetical protein
MTCLLALKCIQGVDDMFAIKYIQGVDDMFACNKVYSGSR